MQQGDLLRGCLTLALDAMLASAVYRPQSMQKGGMHVYCTLRNIMHDTRPCVDDCLHASVCGSMLML